MNNRLTLFSLGYIASITNITKVIEKENKKNIVIKNNKRKLSIQYTLNKNI